MQHWYSSINNSSRLQTYSIFKHTFHFETYLDHIIDNKLRIALTKLRLSSHTLNIESGRHFKIDKKDRVCTNCNLHSIENEYHFILVCPKYRELRLKYFKHYYYSWPNIRKFENLMENNSKTCNWFVSSMIFMLSS